MNEGNINKIHDYLLGRMSIEEKAAFERMLEDVPEMKEALELEEQAMRHVRTAYVRNRIEEAANAYFADAGLNETATENKVIQMTDRGERQRRQNWLLVAASLVILLGFYFTYRNYSSVQNKYDSYLALPEGLPTMMGESTTIDDAMVEYKMQNYGEAVRKFEHLLQQRSSDTLQYYLAMSELGLKKYDKAREQLRQIDAGSVYYDHSQYYSAVFDLFDNKQEAAREKLKRLAARPDFEYAAEVKQLLAEVGE